MKEKDTTCKSICESCKNKKEILGGGTLCSVFRNRVETRLIRKCEAYRSGREKDRKKTVAVKTDWHTEIVDGDGNPRDKTFRKGTEYWELDEPVWIDGDVYPPDEYVYIQSKSSKWGAEWAITKEDFNKYFSRKRKEIYEKKS